jgi:hypothetical protein
MKADGCDSGRTRDTFFVSLGRLAEQGTWEDAQRSRDVTTTWRIGTAGHAEVPRAQVYCSSSAINTLLVVILKAKCTGDSRLHSTKLISRIKN